MATYKELRPNVGFILRELPGYTRTMDIDLPPNSVLGDDLVLETLQGTLLMARTQQGVWVDGKVLVRLPASCARCLEPLSVDLTLELQEMFYSPPSKAPTPQDYVVLETGVLDLNEPVRELVEVGIPLQALCRPDCRGLCSHCGQNLNEGSCDCHEETVDPRFSALLDLKKTLSDE